MPYATHTLSNIVEYPFQMSPAISIKKRTVPQITFSRYRNNSIEGVHKSRSNISLFHIKTQAKQTPKYHIVFRFFSFQKISRGRDGPQVPGMRPVPSGRVTAEAVLSAVSGIRKKPCLLRKPAVPENPCTGTACAALCGAWQSEPAVV
jgi:hypothetical protein